MAGVADKVRPTLLDLCAGLALGALWAAGIGKGALGLALLALLFSKWLPVGVREDESKRSEATAHQAPMPGGTAVHGCFVPPTRLLDFSKSEEVHVVENENCTCTCYVAYRPTDDPARDAAGAYAHAKHFQGRRRLWEIRWQIRVKRRPQRPLVFGLELAEYVPVSGWARRIQQMTVSTLRSVVGKDLYHSCGDDPRAVEGEAERPVFVMPLWAFDQLIISEPGKEPDIRNIEKLGVLRTDGRAEFIRKLAGLELQPDKVYTFAFWCISRFLDVVNWQMLGVVPGGVSFNTFCGRPPVHSVIYELDNAACSQDRRHLQSRKNYFFNLAFWSQKFPPERTPLQDAGVEDASPDCGPDKVSEWRPNLGDGLCCWR